MKLILERNQRTGGVITTKQVFVLKVRAEISEAEREAINKYKLADTVLYQSHDILDPGAGLLGLASRIAMNAMIKKLIVRDLVEGKTFEVADIVEMFGIEGQIKEAAGNFKQILDAAATFGGREVIEM